MFMLSRKPTERLMPLSPMTHFLIFNIKQIICDWRRGATMWFPPDYGEDAWHGRCDRAGFEAGQFYHKGEDVVKLQVSAGDHLFVDRLSYNFRKPQRGEIIVFATAGIPEDRRAAFDAGRPVLHQTPRGTGR